jgi:hypothetical protein
MTDYLILLPGIIMIFEDRVNWYSIMTVSMLDLKNLNGRFVEFLSVNFFIQPQFIHFCETLFEWNNVLHHTVIAEYSSTVLYTQISC